MAFTTSFKVRFADIDLGRVVYFARYADYAHRCFEDFFTEGAKLPYGQMMERQRVGFPIVHAEADYLSPLRVDDEVRIVMEVLRLTRRSVTSRFTLLRGATDERCAVVTLKQACVDLEAFRGTQIPDAIFAHFSAHLLEET